MLVEVTFQAPAVIEADQLGALLGIIKAPVSVQPVDGATPEVPAVQRPIAATEPSAENKPQAKPRGRPTSKKADPAAAQQAAAPAANASSSSPAETGTTPPAAAAPNTDLLERFSSLIDKDYDAALAALEQFGASRFSELKPEQHEAFAAHLSGLGA